MSECIGRNIAYHAGTVVFVASRVECALAPSLGSLLAFRFIQGCGAACPNTIGGGTIADVIKSERRGAAMSLFTAGRSLAPVIGPVIGGYVSQNLGWRWVFLLLTIFVRSLYTSPD